MGNGVDVHHIERFHIVRPTAVQVGNPPFRFIPLREGIGPKNRGDQGQKNEPEKTHYTGNLPGILGVSDDPGPPGGGYFFDQT